MREKNDICGTDPLFERHYNAYMADTFIEWINNLRNDRLSKITDEDAEKILEAFEKFERRLFGE